MKKIILLNLLITVNYFAFSQAGTLDPSFGTGGIVVSRIPPTGNVWFEFARQCIPQSDGKMLVILDVGGKVSIARRLANGDRDVSFANNGYSDFINVSSPLVAIQADGKIVVVGGAQNTPDFLVARFNTDGTLDTGFGTNGMTITDAGTDWDVLQSVIIGNDGKIYAGGFTQTNFINRFALIRYTTGGQPDPAFGQNGIVTTNFDDLSSTLVSIAFTPDNKIIAFGNAGSDYAFARYNLDGSPDLTFNGTGKTTVDFDYVDFGKAFAVSPDGKLYFAGIGVGTPEKHFRIGRLNADGTPDLTFNNGEASNLTGFGNQNDGLTNLLLLPDGKIILAGSTLPGDYNYESYDVALTRLNSDGSTDFSFGTNGTVTSDSKGAFDDCAFLTRTADGQLIAGGYTNRLSDVSIDFTLFRYSADGIPDATFGSAGALYDYIPRSNIAYNDIIALPDSKLLVAGTSNDGNLKSFLSRFNSNGTVDNTFGQNGTVNLSTQQANFYFQPDGKVLVTGYLNSDVQLSRYNPDGTADNNFGNAGTVISDFGSDEGAVFATAQNDGKILVAGFKYTDIGRQLLIIRYNNNGTIDNSFGNSGFITVTAETESFPTSILIQQDGKILINAQGYLYPPDFSYFYFDVVLVRLNPDGTPDNTFGQSGILIKDHVITEYAGLMALQADNKIVYTYYQPSTPNGPLNCYVSRLNSDGTLDNSFGQNGTASAAGSWMVIQPNQKIITGGVAVGPSNFMVSTMKRFNIDGTVDNSFGANGLVSQSYATGDNYVEPAKIIGNSLFLTGFVYDRIQPGIIAKYRLDGGSGITCPPNVTLNTDKNTCSAKVPGIDPTFPQGGTIKYKLTGATKGSGNGSASGKIFNKGITTVTYTLNGDATKTCSFTVTVQDKELPVIDNVSVSDATLWPADHKLKDVTVNYSASDNCGVANTQLSVSSNEPVQSNENGDQSPDWQITDAHHVKLRAERLDAGAGRIYTITITTTDVNGNVNNSTVTVNVPKTKPAPCTLNLSATPNPSHNYFTVSVNSSCSDKINLRVLDNKGTVVSAITNISAPQIVTVGNNLVPGIYYIEATQSGVSKSIKLVKQ